MGVGGIAAAWSGVVAEEEGVAVSIADEEIEITVAINVGEGWAGCPTSVMPKGLVMGAEWSYWSRGVAEEEGVAVGIADEDIKITVAINVGEGWAG